MQVVVVQDCSNNILEKLFNKNGPIKNGLGGSYETKCLQKKLAFDGGLND